MEKENVIDPNDPDINLYEKDIIEIEKLQLSDDIKKVLLEMNDLYWKYANWTPESQGFDYRVAEGIKMCMDLLKKL